MSSSVGNIGLRPTSPTNYTPAFLAFHFIFAYGVLASRLLKMYYGIDHMVSPRYDLKDFGEDAVRSGKLTRRQLEMLKRQESAHANAVENYTLLVGALCMASISGVDQQLINNAGFVYTVARVAYGPIYILIDNPWWSLMRGVAWWVGNGSCLYLLWLSWKAVNA